MPWGDAFIVETPNIDRLSDRLFQQQQQRQVERRRMETDMQDEFAKNISKIRDKDVNDFTKLYEDWKNARMGMMKMRPGSSREYIQSEQEVAKKLAALYSLGNKSMLEKEDEEAMAKKLLDPKLANYYRKDAVALLKARRGLSMSQFGGYKMPGVNGAPETAFDLSDLNKMRYDGTLVDFEPIFKKSQGQLVPMEMESSVTPGGLQTIVKEYKGFGGAQGYYDRLVGQLGGSQKEDDFIRKYGNIDPAYEQSINNKFEELIKDPSIKKRVGELGGSSNPSDVEKLAMFKTKEWVVNNPPRVTRERAITNLEAKADRDEAFRKELEGIRHRNSLSRLYVYAGIKARDEANQNQSVQGVIAQHINSARENGGTLPVDAATYKAITGEDMKKSSFLTIDNNGNYSYGNYDYEGKLGSLKEIPYDLALAKLTQKYKSGLDGKYNQGADSPKPQERLPKDIQKTRMKPTKGKLY